MKNVLKVFCFIAIVAVIGFSMAACEDDSDTTEPDTGRLLLTDIPQKYNGGYIHISPNFTNSDKSLRLGGFQSYDFRTTATTWVKISNGKANIPIWIIDGYKAPEKYYGNDTVTSTNAEVYIHKEATNNEANYTVLARGLFLDGGALTIVFVNGSAEKSLKDVWWYINNVD